MVSNGSKQQNIKDINRALVLRMILNENIITRAEIARKLELTKTTLTNIVGELIQDGLLVESDALSGENTMGRKSIGLDLAPGAPVVCGFLIQRGNLHVVLANLKGQLLSDEKYSYFGRLEVKEFQRILTDLYRKVIATTDKTVFAVGISCIGALNILEGTMLNPYNFFEAPCNFEIVKFIENLTGLPAWLCNDATSGAIAEKYFGKGHNEENFIYVSPFNGIGAGLYLDGRLFNGTMGQSGELGHMSIDFRNTYSQHSEAGYLDTYADIQQIAAGYSHFLEFFPSHPLLGNAPITITDVLQQVDNHDVLAMAMMTEFCRYLSTATANLLTQLNVNLVILAGSPNANSHFFEHTLEHMINEKNFLAQYQKNIVVKSDFGMDSPLYGSVGVIVDKVFNGEIYPVAAQGK